jgi:hypothetical protein
MTSEADVVVTVWLNGKDKERQPIEWSEERRNTGVTLKCRRHEKRKRLQS